MSKPLKAQDYRVLREIKRHSSIYFLLILPVAYFIIFRYFTIWNGQIAFRDFLPYDEWTGEGGVTGSKWVGLKHFVTFVSSYYFWELIRNTLLYSFGKLLISIPASIILAVVLFETTRRSLAKVVQTLAYLPHFLSWVIMYGILLVLLAPGDGVFNDVIKFFGGESVNFLTDVKKFPFVVILSETWKEMGWGAIIFIAALIGIPPELYEAAMVEGANAPQRVWYITLPSIRPVIVTVLLLRLGTILDAGFNQIFMLYSPGVYRIGDIIDTWVYRQGLLNFEFGLAAAAGIFKGTIGLITIMFSNWLVRKFSDSSVF